MDVLKTPILLDEDAVIVAHCKKDFTLRRKGAKKIRTSSSPQTPTCTKVQVARTNVQFSGLHFAAILCAS